MVSSAYTYTPTSTSADFLKVRSKPKCSKEKAPASSLLDTPEITSPTSGEDSDSGSTWERMRLAEALRNMPGDSSGWWGDIGPEELARKVETCGLLFSRFKCSACEQLHDVPQLCHFKLCPTCCIARAARLRERYAGFIDEMDTPVLVTFTMRNRPAGQLRAMWADIMRSFSTLRRLPLWKDHVAGGIRSIECPWNGEAQSWHVHIHCLIDMPGGLFTQSGEFKIPVFELRSEWERITGDSWGVDIRKADLSCVHEIVKYLTKSWDLIDHPHALAELISVSYRKRLTQAFGSWFGRKVEKDPDAVAPCPSCGELCLVFIRVVDPRDGNITLHLVTVRDEDQAPGTRT